MESEEIGKDIKFLFTKDRSEALQIVSEDRVIGIVADLRYSKFDTRDFLDLLQHNFPNVFRLCLTSPYEREKTLLLAKKFHRSIKFPLNHKELSRTLRDLVKLFNHNLDAVLVEKINSLGPVPVLPEIYLRIQNELSRPSFSMNRIAEIIQTDPLMVARILHIAHSSYYNIPAGVTNLLQALNFLGMDIIKTLVLYVKIFSLNNVSPQTQAVLKEVKIHSMNVAKNSKAIMEKETKDKKAIELAYITGLLHDIGKIVLLQFNEHVKNPNYASNIHGFSSFEFENASYGISHVQVGIYILKLWGFQDEIIEAVASHHDSRILKGKNVSLKETLFIANAFCYDKSELTADISESYGSEKFDQWDHLFNDDIRPALDLPI